MTERIRTKFIKIDRDLSTNGYTISDLREPLLDHEAANKSYVDDRISMVELVDNQDGTFSLSVNSIDALINKGNIEGMGVINSIPYFIDEDILTSSPMSVDTNSDVLFENNILPTTTDISNIGSATLLFEKLFLNDSINYKTTLDIKNENDLAILSFVNDKIFLSNIQGDPSIGSYLKSAGNGELIWVAETPASAKVYVTDSLIWTSIATLGDGSLASNDTIDFVNTPGNYVSLYVGGIKYRVGDGVLTTNAYFSSDNGVTPKTYDNITIGDKLYWNGGVSGFDLELGMEIEIIYIKEN